MGYLQAHQPLTVWAAGDPSVTTLFAAPRNGSVVKMRRSGSVLRLLAELALPASMPTTFTWEMLAVIDDETLLGLASPGLTMVAWSIRRGKHLGTWTLPAMASMPSWCANKGTHKKGLYGARPSSASSAADSNVWELYGLPLPEI